MGDAIFCCRCSLQLLIQQPGSPSVDLHSLEVRLLGSAASSVSFVGALWPAFPSLPPELGLGVCAEVFFFLSAGESSLLVVLHSHVGALLLKCVLL